MHYNIMTIVGARPQFVKAAVISRLIRSVEYSGKVSEILVHTGQHYDRNMSEIFFEEMKIPAPDINLGVGGGSHGAMTGTMLAGLESLMIERKPDIVMVYGDTNSTLAGALAASKLHLRIAHVEAGLRSYDKEMPEEQNRILTDHVSSWLLCPTKTAVDNLLKEGLCDSGKNASANTPRIMETGDVMLDASLYYKALSGKRKEDDRILTKIKLAGSYRLLTLHRAENTDNLNRLSAIVDALNAASDCEIVFPIHPRTRKSLLEAGLKLADHIRLIEPVGFLDMLDLESSASCILTDSGGVQKEAYFFRVPCITLRDTTEWVETVESGWNHLAGADSVAIGEAIKHAVPGREGEPLYGDGNAGAKILDTILETA